MKKQFTFLAFSVLLITGKSMAQVYSPIATTGYTLDAVAENTTAASTTGGAIDGSDYVMYSHAYGLLYSTTATGLPDNGIITGGNRTYQLRPYTGPNVLYLPGGALDSLVLTTPAAYPAISLLGMATEGAGTLSITVRFSDNSVQTYTNLALGDWFSATTTFYSGFDRCGRTTGTPGYAGTANPRLSVIDLNIACTNNTLTIKSVKIKNTNASTRLCIMALSGASPVTYNAIASPVSCVNGTNGSATLAATAGLPPFTYTWSTSSSVNSNSSVFGLTPGTYSCTVKDAAGCIATPTVAIGVSSTPLPPLNVTASSNALCAGRSATLNVSGAITYQWATNSATTTVITVTPAATTVYNVTGTNYANCPVSGNISITVNPLPVPVIAALPAVVCAGAPNIALNATPSGGTFSGAGVSFNVYYPIPAGAGTHTLVYNYTDANGCSGSSSATTSVASNTIAIAFDIAPSFCSYSPTVALNATPTGGTFEGPGTIGGVFNPAMGVGTRTVSYTYTDANNCSAKKTVSSIVSQCTGINQLTAANTALSVYPNPASGAVNIKSDVSVTLVIVNELGQTVRSIKLDDFNGRQTVIENLTAGIYFVQSTDNSTVVKQKLVITK